MIFICDRIAFMTNDFTKNMKNSIVDVQRRFDFINKYGQNFAYRLNEGLYDTDMSGWINIGVVKNGSNIGNGGDAYLMVNPSYPKTDDVSTFVYRATGYNTKPDGTGKELTLSSYDKQNLKIYNEYRDTYYGEVFLGRKKNDSDLQKHQIFMDRLDKRNDGTVILKHDSNVKIKDGVITKGVPNNYSKNSDIGIYFWGSKERGIDQSNNSLYTYYCLVDISDIYDFENDLDRFGTIHNALKAYKYVAQYWKGSNAIVVNTNTPTPFSAIRDNNTGTVFENF